MAVQGCQPVQNCGQVARLGQNHTNYELIINCSSHPVFPDAPYPHISRHYYEEIVASCIVCLNCSTFRLAVAAKRSSSLAGNGMGMQGGGRREDGWTDEH